MENENRSPQKKTGLMIAIIISAVVIVALCIFGAVKFFSRSTMPEGYPVASGEGTEFEGAGGAGASLSAGIVIGGETGTSSTDTAGSATVDSDTAGLSEDVDGDSAAEGITDIEYAPEYLAAMEKAKEQMAGMTTEEKVAQLFFVSFDALTEVSSSTVAGDITRAKLLDYPVGGIILFAKNITDPQQVSELTKGLHEISAENGGVPVMVGVDEEGGVVARIGGRNTFPEKNVGAMAEIGQAGDQASPEDIVRAKETGEYIGGYLKKYGFDIDFAPVVDVYTNPENTVIGTRAFGTTPERVTDMSEAFREGLEAQGVQSCIKHYPGHGDTQADSHYGVAVTNKTLDELMACEFIPFQQSIRAGAKLVMVSHISAPNVTGDMVPASLSNKMVNEILRGELGYDDVVVTDDLSMGAISQLYTPAEACIKSIQAGVDWVMVTTGFVEAYNGVLEAVQKGEISAERLDESVRRILILKSRNGLLF